MRGTQAVYTVFYRGFGGGGGGGSLSITVNDCNTTYVCRFDVCREQEGGGGVITKYSKGAAKCTWYPRYLQNTRNAVIKEAMQICIWSAGAYIYIYVQNLEGLEGMPPSCRGILS